LTRYILFDLETSGLDPTNAFILAVSFYDSADRGVIHVVRGAEARIIEYLFQGPWAEMLERPWPDLEVVSFNGLRFDLPFMLFSILRDMGRSDAWDFFSRRLLRFQLDLKQFARLETGSWGNSALQHIVRGYVAPTWHSDIYQTPPWVGKTLKEIGQDLWDRMTQYQFDPKLQFPVLVVDPDKLRLDVVSLFD